MLLGLALAQVIATLQVHASNQSLFAKMTAVAAAGFQPVPTGAVLTRLNGFETAFGGAILFTLSVGAGVSILSMAAAWLWTHLRAKPRLSAGCGAGLWAVVLLVMNRQGFDGWVTLYFLLIPPPVFALTLRDLRGNRRSSGERFWLTRGVPLAVLALAWFTQYDRDLFIELRDHLLWSNPVGKTVSSFYYRYTLYPAEVFKPLSQRQVKAVAVTPAGDDPQQAAVTKELVQHDYLPVAGGSRTDLQIEREGNRLRVRQRGEIVVDLPRDRFLEASRRALDEVSAATDRWGAFRGFTFWCVLMAFPIALYILAFGGLRLAAGIVLRERLADYCTAGACVVLGLAILAHYLFSREPVPHADAIPKTLASGNWQQQTAALKAMRDTPLDICDFPEHGDWLRSPHPQLRYWLARALAQSRCPQASEELRRLLRDPHLNVRTMALEGLAQRNDRSAVRLVLKYLQDSQEWYEQLYAYRTLRALGWKQSASR
jgi:hypothetical protein